MSRVSYTFWSRKNAEKTVKIVENIQKCLFPFSQYKNRQNDDTYRAIHTQQQFTNGHQLRTRCLRMRRQKNEHKIRYSGNNKTENAY